MSEEKTSVHAVEDLLKESRQNGAAYLIVISAKSPATIGRMTKLDKAELIMGRSSETALQIEDDGVSRKHAKVVQASSGHFQLVDLGSTNGTFLNGIKVSVANLQDGDKIQIGSNTVLKFSIQDQLEEQYQRSIYESATRDGLTRIFNKKYFLDTLRKEFAYCLRHRVALSLVMFDVDHFKRINDDHGHAAGDQVLAAVARALQGALRAGDFAARLGGEEFLVGCVDADAARAATLGERLRAAVAALQPTPPASGTSLHCTVSVGISRSITDAAQWDAALREADQALYAAKQGGRNRVVRADAEVG